MTGPYLGHGTNTEFECDHSHNWLDTPQNIVTNGGGCPSCQNKKVVDDINGHLKHRGIKIIGPYIDKSTKTLFGCHLGHQWSASPKQVMHRTGCPICGGKLPLLKEEINSSLFGRGIYMVGDYTNAKTKTMFACNHGHQWMATPGNVRRGSGCPECATSGYDPSKSAYLYGIDFGNYIKYGITNNLKSRLDRHKRNGPYNILFTKLYETGHIAREVEKTIKCQLGGSFVTKETMPDGYTETLCITKLNLLMEIINNQ